MSARHSTDFSEMVQVKEKEKEMKFELNYIQEQLRKEQDKVKQFQEQVRSTAYTNEPAHEIMVLIT